MICDDSALIRSVLRQIIEKNNRLRFVDYARNGEEAVEKAVLLKPDVLVLDIEMPKMDGITALKEIVQKTSTKVIIFSSLTTEGAQKTLEAIENGAFDCVAKPKGMANITALEKELLLKINEASKANLKREQNYADRKTLSQKKEIIPQPVRQIDSVTRQHSDFGYKIVAIGISTGGPKTIMEVLPKLPANFPSPVVIVQHMPAEFTRAYAQRINSRTKIPCMESEAGMEITPGNIYVAQGGFHLKLMRKSGNKLVIRQTKEPQHLFMPSVDIMFDSVVENFKADTVGVLMTGMGWDGAEGMVKIAQAGGVTIAESEETAIVFGMPQEAIKRGGAKIVAPNYLIAEEIIKAVKENI